MCQKEEIMIQTELVYRQPHGLTPFSYTVVNSVWLYFFDEHMPVLFRYNMETEVCEYIAVFDKNLIKSNFYKIFSWGNDLWILPLFKEKIVCFNIQTQDVTYYDISEKVEEVTMPFVDMYFFEKKGYIIPHGKNRYLLEVDLISHKIQEIKLLETDGESRQIFFEGAVEINNRIYLEDSLNNTFVVYDNNFAKVISVKDCLLKNKFPKRVGNKIYLFPIHISEDEEVLIYDIDMNEFTKKDYPIKELPHGEVCITEILGKEIWILANKKKRIYRLGSNLEIISDISIVNFNKDEKIVYISGRTFADSSFWSGNSGTPLIQIKDGAVQILEIKKDILEVYIEILKKIKASKRELKKFDIGKLIYNNTIS